MELFTVSHSLAFGVWDNCNCELFSCVGKCPFCEHNLLFTTPLCEGNSSMWRKAPACFFHHHILTHTFFPLCRLSWGDLCFLQPLCILDLWSVLWSPVSCPSPQALALPFTITAPFPHIVYQEDRGVILSLFLFLSTSSFQMHISLPGGRFLSCSDANLSCYYLGHFTVMKYFKCHLIPASNVKTSEELPACITLLLLLHLPPLLSSIQVPISFYPWNAPPSFFPSLLLGGQMVPFSFGLSLKTCFCKCPFPQLYSRKEEIKNNFLSIPDVAYIPGGKCAYPHLNKWKKMFY